MSIVLPALGVTFAAFAVWLAVRIINRRERWAKRMAVALTAALVYGMSFGPACWITSHLGRGTNLLPTIYRPLMVMMRIGEEAKERRVCDSYSWMVRRPEGVPNVPEGWLVRFASLGAPAGWRWRYVAIYTIRPVTNGDGRIRLGDVLWEWTDGP